MLTEEEAVLVAILKQEDAEEKERVANFKNHKNLIERARFQLQI
jgi:hypothetical protein